MSTPRFSNHDQQLSKCQNIHLGRFITLTHTAVCFGEVVGRLADFKI